MGACRSWSSRHFGISIALVSTLPWKSRQVVVEVAPSLLHPVAFPAHAVVGGGLYLAGGLAQDGAPVAHVQVGLLSGMHFGANGCTLGVTG